MQLPAPWGQHARNPAICGVKIQGLQTTMAAQLETALGCRPSQPATYQCMTPGVCTDLPKSPRRPGCGFFSHLQAGKTVHGPSSLHLKSCKTPQGCRAAPVTTRTTIFFQDHSCFGFHLSFFKFLPDDRKGTVEHQQPRTCRCSVCTAKCTTCRLALSPCRLACLSWGTG